MPSPGQGTPKSCRRRDHPRGGPMDFSQPQILGTLLLLVGVGVVVQSIRTSRKVEAAQLWPSVKGRVTTSVVKRSGGKNRVYRAKIRYTYSVAGFEFTGRRYALGRRARHLEPRARRGALREVPRRLRARGLLRPLQPEGRVPRAGAGGQGLHAAHRRRVRGRRRGDAAGIPSRRVAGGAMLARVAHHRVFSPPDGSATGAEAARPGAATRDILAKLG